MSEKNPKTKVPDKNEKTEGDSNKTSQDRDFRKWLAGALLALKIPQGDIAGLVGISREHFNQVWQYDPIVEKAKAEYEEKLTGEVEPLFFGLVEEIKKIAFAKVSRVSASEKMAAIDRLLSFIDKKPAEKYDITSGGKPLNQLSDEELVRVAKLLKVEHAIDTGSEKTPDPENTSNSGDQKETVAK